MYDRKPKPRSLSPVLSHAVAEAAIIIRLGDGTDPRDRAVLRIDPMPSGDGARFVMISSRTGSFMLRVDQTDELRLREHWRSFLVNQGPELAALWTADLGD